MIAYDRAGLGASDPADRVTLESSVDDLTAVVRHVGGPCVLVGNSWGALLAQLVAWATPELVAGLVLVDPAHEEFQPRFATVAEAAMIRVLAMRQALGLLEKSVRRSAVADARALTDDPKTQDLLVDADVAGWAHRQQMRTVIAESRLTAAQVPTIRRLRAAAPPFGVPVVVLSATVGLPAGPRARWTALQAQIAADAEHVVVPEASHYIHSSQPAAVTKAVLSVVDRVT
jgi:pimeloyl-ACP methyl ester carboxylesterase